ncbi:serine hydrolase [Nocardia sp. NBC_00508]|uniref:serine hydrolase n=1 Tax=Nocardia sp. NBC_00508 TaxID=2975992 RepID=UPI002E80E86D|nr:serine hydrolase [Nocardia sp. NBC_00508]WUD68761.1 serine hydrolase [Nocardia sp. NBC_00508]
MLARVPTLPRLPDLVRRSHIPEDLDSVASIGAEVAPTDLGLAPDYAERIWRRMRLVYRSGVHPAIQVCVRRHGQVVFDRALGHAHGNGLAHNYPTGMPPLPPLSSAMDRLLGISFAEAVETGNDPAYLSVIAPAANLVSTAVEFTRFYEIFRRGGELDGVRLMRPGTIAAALVPQSRIEPDLMLGMNFGFGYGPMLGGRVFSLFGPDTRRAFGHLGFTNNVAWADPERALTCAVLTSGKPILYPEVARWIGLLYGITSETPKVAETDLAF